jgi:hypothetical protein
MNFDSDTPIGKLYEKQILNAMRMAMFGVENPWTPLAEKLTGRLLNYTHTNTDDFLQTLHWLQRMDRIHNAGVASNIDFAHEVHATFGGSPPDWPLFPILSGDPAPLHKRAANLYNMRDGADDVGLIVLGTVDGVREMGKWLVEKCLEKQAPFVVAFVEPRFDDIILRHADAEGKQKYSNSCAAFTKPVTRVMSILPVREPAPKASFAPRR